MLNVIQNIHVNLCNIAFGKSGLEDALSRSYGFLIVTLIVEKCPHKPLPAYIHKSDP